MNFCFGRVELEKEQAALVSLLNQALEQNQHLLKKNEQSVLETQALISLDSLCKKIAVLISMKKVPLQKASPSDLSSLKMLKDVNAATKSLESDMDKEIDLLSI